MRVVVACATARGSTRGVAHRIADRIAAHGNEVTVRPVDAVSSFTPSCDWRHRVV